MKSLRPVFVCVLGTISLTAVFFLFSGQIIYGLLLFLVAHVLLLYATLNPSSQLLGPVVTSFQTGKKEVWLTIDDGPDEKETPLVLDLLDQYQAKATFFVIGREAEANPDIVRLILERGHRIGNHTMNHLESWFWSLPRGRVEMEIDDCSAIIKEITGESPQFFRAPVGHKPWPLHTMLYKMKLPLIGWTARGFDGVSTDSERIAGRVQNGLVSGAIILLHEGRGSLPETLRKILSGLSDKGYRCVLPSPETFVCGRRKTSK